MDKIIRCITSDGAVMASAIDASDIVFKAQKIHGLSRSGTHQLTLEYRVTENSAL